MSLYVCHPETETTPAEYCSDNEQECAKCMAFIDLDEEPYLELDELVPGRKFTRQIVCDDCRESCALCGEWLTAPSKAVRLRCIAVGKIEPYCPTCAEESWAERLLDFAERHDYFLPWPMADFPRLGNGNQPYEPNELGGDQIARLYRFYIDKTFAQPKGHISCR